jgi:hypothetical protein
LFGIQPTSEPAGRGEGGRGTLRSKSAGEARKLWDRQNSGKEIEQLEELAQQQEGRKQTIAAGTRQAAQTRGAAPAAGGAQVAAEPAAGEQQAAGDAAQRTLERLPVTTTGLSLPIEIPTDGQKLNFVKVGGDAKLLLGLRPKSTLESLLGLLWLLVVGGIVAWSTLALLGRREAALSFDRVAAGLAALGAATFLVFPAGVALAWIGLALFVAGSLMLARRLVWR